MGLRAGYSGIQLGTSARDGQTVFVTWGIPQARLARPSGRRW